MNTTDYCAAVADFVFSACIDFLNLLLFSFYVVTLRRGRPREQLLLQNFKA